MGCDDLSLPADPPEPTAAEVEPRRRSHERAEASFRLATAPYLGLTREQAQVRADAEGRLLRVHEYGIRKRADFMPARLHVAIDHDGLVRQVKAG